MIPVDAEKPIEFLAEVVQTDHKRWSCGREELVINQSARLIAKAVPPATPAIEAKVDMYLKVLQAALGKGAKTLADLESALARLAKSGALPTSWTVDNVSDKVYDCFAEFENKETGMISEHSISEMCDKIANEA